MTQRRLTLLVERQRAYVCAGGARERWERIAKAPWYVRTGGRRNPAVLEQADLRGLDLRGLDLPCANLRLAICTEQDLSGAKLDGGLLREAFFAASSFRSASLRDCDLTQARLARCDFSGADLAGAVFENADLTGARIDWAAAGKGRYRVVRWEGTASGGYGEHEQDFAHVVIDQKTGREITRFEGHFSKSYFGNDPGSSTGPVHVRILDDARTIEIEYDGGKIERRAI
jgi:hypothetical protein